MKPTLATLPFFLALAAPLAAQSELPIDAMLVVTDAGLFVPSPTSSTPELFVPASSFQPAGQLDRPRVEWQKGTDTVLVASRDGLWAVDVVDVSAGTVTVTDITPGGATLDPFDIDIHAGTGELFLLDQAADRVVRYAPPFSFGMLPDLEIPVGSSARAMAVDSRNLEPAVLVCELGMIRRVRFDGIVSDVAAANTDSIDQDAQSTDILGTYFSGNNASLVGVANNNPGFFVDMNKKGGCQPLVPAPRGLAWHALANRAMVYTEEPLHPFCASLATGGHHVVSFPTAQVPGVVEPEVATNPSGSGIFGSNGDISLVVDDFAYTSPYGEGCFAAGIPDDMSIDILGSISVTHNLVTIEIENGEPFTGMYLLLGIAPLEAPLAGGCLLYNTADVIQFLAPADAQGALTVVAPFAPAPLLGLDLYLQAGQSVGGALRLSQGLKVHIGL